MDVDYIYQLEQRVSQLALELHQTKTQLQLEKQDRLQAESALRESKELRQQILDSIDAGIAFVNAELRYQFVNRFYEVRFNRPRESILNKYVWDVIGSKAYASIKSHIDRVLIGEPQSFEFEMTYLDGQCVYLSSCLTPAFDTSNQIIGYYLFVFDITERRRLEQSLQAANAELEQLVTLDGLTHVANRRKFDDYLAQVWRNSVTSQEPLSLIMFDIDSFKRYNDYYGHQTGDLCLIKIAQVVQATVKRATDLVARYGGEEFAVILPDTHLSGAVAIAEQIQQAIKALAIPHACSDVSTVVSISLGIASIASTKTGSPQKLIAAADRALYAAKLQGRNCYTTGTE
ncbi:MULTISPECIES: diguanylate cyclase [unclassified Leptolyngbya]|uniref:GGDEF domain-containing protein n=1 Tax=unclassified Leptolyngbya TaxID=2650499 RepID=UPI0016893178|nr:MULTISPECIES: diguanylate cyclase [unclassified Leptolyngbya]MBD1909492.1 diguanylate cyclase [Leptolyngbya sp. FACHB-8]MBD2159023.1 diguanylate cyclase [Leptolyngbya sp. FACHB-16]